MCIRDRSRTALNGSGSDLGTAGGSQTLRARCRTDTSSSMSVGSDKKTDGKPSSPAKTVSTNDSPRRSSSSVPPPVPPKHTHSLKAEKRSQDTGVPPMVVARSSSTGSSAAVQGLSAGSSPSPGDSGTLPFANENVGTIRQRGAAVPVEQPTAAETSMNNDVTVTTGKSFTCDACLPFDI